MGTRSQCGNTYDKTFEIVMDGEAYVFDCFKYEIAALVPRALNAVFALSVMVSSKTATSSAVHIVRKRKGVTGLVDRY